MNEWNIKEWEREWKRKMKNEENDRYIQNGGNADAV